MQHNGMANIKIVIKSKLRVIFCKYRTFFFLCLEIFVFCHTVSDGAHYCHKKIHKSMQGFLNTILHKHLFSQHGNLSNLEDRICIIRKWFIPRKAENSKKKGKAKPKFNNLGTE